MPADTKDRILEAALEIFANNGYDGANLKDISESVGVVKSALYRHYESKEDVWNAVIDKAEAYYREKFGSRERMPKIPESCDELFSLTMHMVDFTIHDKKIIMTRKLLLTEQFRDEHVRKLATEHFLSGTKAIFAVIFENMATKGLIRNEDPGMLAFAYTSPITSLIHYCNREPEKEPEIMKQIEAFVKYFIRIYGKQ